MINPNYPPDYGPDPVLGMPPGQPIPISQPPFDPNLAAPPANPGDAAGEIYQATYGQDTQRPPTEQERSAMMYLEAAQKTLSAAADELPSLGPAIQQAGQILSMGIQNLLATGQGFPIAQPPSQPPMPPAQPMGPSPSPDAEAAYGGGIRGAAPENIPLPGLM